MPRKPKGKPVTLTPEQRLEVIAVRLNAAHRAEFRRRGAEALRRWLDTPQQPATQESKQ